MTDPADPASSPDPAAPRPAQPRALDANTEVDEQAPTVRTPVDSVAETVLEPGPAATPGAETAVLSSGQASAPRSDRLSVPERLGDYRVLRQLGRGGAGAVYVARSERLDRMVAIKLLHAREDPDGTLRERFMLEARSAARLQHPNVVGIHEVGEDEAGHPYLVMELIPGRSLAERLARDGPLAPREAARIGLGLARALAYAHGRGILHRDVKPHNVLLDAQGEPHLGDFGLAKLIEGDSPALTVSGVVMGTPAYMPPEQASGELVDARSDVYALGATLYEMLTGRAPFSGPSLPAILARVTGPEPAASPASLRAGLDPDPVTITMKCLEKDPGERYRSAQEVADELGRYLAEEPILARPLGPLGRLRKWLRRNRAVTRALLSSGALAFVLGVAGTVGFLLQLRAERDRANAAALRSEKLALEGRLALDVLVREVRDELADLPGEQLRQARARLLASAAQLFERLSRLEAAQGALPAAMVQVEIGDLALEAGLTRQALDALDLAVAAARRAVGGEEVGAYPLLFRALRRRAEARRSAGLEQLEGEDLREALSLRERVARSAPGPDWTLELGLTWCALASCQRGAADPSGALASAGQALGCVAAAVGGSEPARTQLWSGSLAEAGRAWYALGDGRRALAALEGALRLDRALAASDRFRWVSRRALCVSLVDLADVSGTVGDKPRALQALEEAVELARALGQEDPSSADAHRLYSVCSLRLAEAYHEAGELRLARALNEEGLSECRARLERDPASGEAQLDLSDALLQSGRICWTQGAPELALERLGEAVGLQRALLAREPDHPKARGGLALALGIRGEVARTTGLIAEARECLTEGLSVLGAEGGPIRWEARGRLLLLEGELALEDGEPELAVAAARGVLESHRAEAELLDAVEERIKGERLLGRALVALDRLDEAEACYLRAEEAARKLGGRAMGEDFLTGLVASVLLNHGELDLARGRLPQARESFERALALRRGSGGGEHASRESLVLLTRLAEVRQRQGDLSGAAAALGEVHAAQAARLAEDPSPGTARDLAVAALKWGEALDRAGDPAAALERFQEAWRRFAALAEGPPEAGALRDLYAISARLIRALLQHGRAQEAEAPLERLLAAARARRELLPEELGTGRDLSGALLKRADVLQAQGRQAEALEALRVAVEHHRTLAGAYPQLQPEVERLEAVLEAARQAAGEPDPEAPAER